MASISKLLEASDKVQLPAQSTYSLPANKMYFLTQAACAVLVCVMMYLANLSFSSTYTLLVSIGGGIYALIALYLAFTSQVTFDEQGISMPGSYPFTHEKLAWEDVSRAELTGVITYRYFIERIIKSIFSSAFANAELHVTYRNLPGGATGNFAILNRVGDKATALRIIREKLGDRFTVYQGEY